LNGDFCRSALLSLDDI
jgi:hypothetical protein